MRRFMLGSVGIALGLGAAAHADGPEVIATNKPQAKVAAVLGAPAPVTVAPGILPVSAVYRGQNSDVPKPMPATPDAATPPLAPSTPLGKPTPLGPPMPDGQPYTTSGPLPPGAIVSGPPKPASTIVSPIPPVVSPVVTPVAPYCASAGPLPTGTFVMGPAAVENRWYVSGEYLYWWVRDGAIPPLVTSGSAADANPGALGQTGTQVLFGNDSLNTQGRSGFRFNMGRWFGPCQQWAIEGGFFFLGQRTNNFAAAGDGSPTSPILGRPFFNVNTGLNDVEIFAQPGVRGNINIDSTSNFYGANLDWRRKLWSGCAYRIDGVLGFRYLNFDEDLNVNENALVVATNLPQTGFSKTESDRFSVDNDFYGGTIGVIQELQRGRWTFSLNTRVSLGSTHQQLEIAGGQTITDPAAGTQVLAGGLLARPGIAGIGPQNIGVYTANTFAVVPEVNFNIGYQISPHWRVFAGYSFLYWSNMLRVGDQIDTSVNIVNYPFFPQPPAPGVGVGTNRPTVLMRETDFWAQGVNAGVQFTW